MSQDSKPSQSGPPAGTKPVQIQQSSLSGLASDVVSNCLYNIIHDLVLDVHRSEKLLRMQSAATLAEQAAVAQAADAITSTPNNKNNAPSQPLAVKLDTPGAIYDNGKVYLRGNPFKTTPEIICPACHLPRLLYPTVGRNSRPPDPTKQYCTRHPFVQKPGHDIHGQPFSTEADNKPPSKKKDKDLLKSTLSQQQSRSEKDGTPTSSQGDDQEGNTAGADGSGKLTGPGSRSALAPKPANYIPWQTCPTCKRSLLITRFAQHMEKCLGIGGRQSSRAAMAKMSGKGEGSSAAGTPMGSRGGTPVPNSKDGGEDEDTPPKKSKPKKKDKEGKAAGSTKEKPKKDGGKAKDAAKRLPKPENGKREREKDDTGDMAETPRKKLKISLGGSNKDAGPLSAVSVASNATGGTRREQSVAGSEAHGDED
ncbi:MAG: hypothetical protein M1820_002459 [Bogoriella megaspora]|nr:MAG: hypothetical protein M1820_002459 [Bogoriella megaspora]